MSYSEKTQRELDRYTRNLVKRMPGWLKKFFDEGSVFFAISDEGLLELAATELVSPEQHSKAAELIGKYMDKHPSPILGMMEVQ